MKTKNQTTVHIPSCRISAQRTLSCRSKPWLSAAMISLFTIGISYAQTKPSLDVTPTTDLKSSDSVEVTANPSTLENLKRVDLYTNNGYYGSDESFPFSFTLLNLKENSYSIQAVAYYEDGEQFSSDTQTIIVGSPPVTIKVNSEDSWSPGGYNIECTAYTGSPGAIDRVDFYRNDDYVGTDKTFPYTASLSGLQSDLYRLSAIVYYENGDSFETNAIDKQVFPPVVNIKNLAKTKKSGRVVLSEVILKKYSPGDVDRVEFYLNGTYQLKDDSSPFTAIFPKLKKSKYRVSATVYLSNDEQVFVTSKTIRFKR